MTVQELIDELLKVDDKNKQVVLSCDVKPYPRITDIWESEKELEIIIEY